MKFLNKAIINFVIALTFLFLVFFIIFTSFIVVTKHKFKQSDFSRIIDSNYKLSSTVTVFGRGQETISARFAFYTLDGNLIHAMERSWQGWELLLDCKIVNTSCGYLVFPHSIFTDQTKNKKGFKLFRYYDADNFPEIYNFLRITSIEKKDLKRIFFMVKLNNFLPIFSSIIKNETLSIRSFEANFEYSIFINEEGKLSLTEL